METKKCTKCGEEKELSEFNKHKASSDGLYPRCRDCQKEYKKQQYWANPEKHRERNRKHRDKNKNFYNERKRERYWADPEKFRLRQKLYRKENPEKIKEIERRKYKKRYNKILEYNREYRCKNEKKVKKWEQRSRDNNRENINEKSRKRFKEHSEKVTDHYVKMLLTANGSILNFSDIPDSVVRLKRAQIKHLRMINQLKQMIDEKQ